MFEIKVGFYGGKFLPPHLGHVNAIVQANNQCDKLYVILSYSKERDRNLCKNIKEMPANVRLSWLRQITRDMEHVEVIAIEDNAPNAIWAIESGREELVTSLDWLHQHGFVEQPIVDD